MFYLSSHRKRNCIIASLLCESIRCFAKKYMWAYLFIFLYYVCFPIIALRSLFCSSSVSKVDSFTGNYFILLYDKNSDAKFRAEFYLIVVANGMYFY